MKSLTYGNARVFTVTQNSRQLPEYLKVMSGSSTISNLRYQYDANANITSITDAVTSSANRSMGYDGLDRLTSASGLWGSGSYTYDVLGNLKTKTEGGQAMTYNYNTSLNRLTGITGANPRSFTYDAYGNVTNNGLQGFTYNLAGQMVSSTLPSISYQYDGNDRRVIRTEGGQATYSVYSQAGQLLHKKVGGVSTDYIYAGSMLVAEKQGSTTNYIHSDLLGSPIDGVSGSTSYTENYRPWGDKIDNPIQLAGDVGYTGHQSDVATGLIYMQARYYDAVIGRFMSNDPIGFTHTNPMTFNRFSYANNNPLKFSDPSGMNAESDARARSNARCEEEGGCKVYRAGGGHINAEAADEADVYTQERLGAIHRDATQAASLAGDALEIVAEAEMLVRGAKLAGVGFGILARTLGTKRAMRASDLGLEGRVTLLRGTVELRRGILTMRVDMIKGKISNPLAVFGNMKTFARGAGATTLRIEGRTGNERLDALLRSRYGLRTRDDGVDVIDILLD
jgi:RHS repeat-associated protein